MNLDRYLGWSMTKKKLIVLLLITLCTFALAGPVQAQSGGASLSIGDGSGQPGDAGISVSVRLNSDAGTEVSGLNFDVTFDSSRLTVQNVSIGGAASSAGKSLSWSVPSAGRVRVIIFGLNQTAISNGTIAAVVFSVNASAASGSSTSAARSWTGRDCTKAADTYCVPPWIWRGAPVTPAGSRSGRSTGRNAGPSCMTRSPTPL